ncbi:MAG: ATP-grasp domain-containing protein, partial [Ktedonobacterales bacterium]
MRLIYCADPLRPRQPDANYAAEVVAATAVGAQCALINFEALTLDGDAERALQRIAPADTPGQPTLAIYRGWMLRPPQYAQLYGALLTRGLRLINDPTAYRYTHYLPESYAVITAHTPQTVWFPLNTSAVNQPPERQHAEGTKVPDPPVLRPFKAENGPPQQHAESGSSAILDMDRVMAALQPFGDTPLILKDYVKSRKHEWAEACYIPSAADRQAVERV